MRRLGQKQRADHPAPREESAPGVPFRAPEPAPRTEAPAVQAASAPSGAVGGAPAAREPDARSEAEVAAVTPLLITGQSTDGQTDSASAARADLPGGRPTNTLASVVTGRAPAGSMWRFPCFAQPACEKQAFGIAVGETLSFCPEHGGLLEGAPFVHAEARAPRDADAPGALDPTFDRKTGIGASEIAALAGLSPFATALDIYNLKLGLVEPGADTPWTKAGKYLEPAIARWYADEMKVELDGDGATTFRHPKHSWLFASPDRLVRGTKKAVQIKNVGWFRKDGYGENGGDAIPDHVSCQVTQEAAVLGLEEVDVVPLIGGNDFRIYTIRFDPELWATLFKIAERFWFEHVVPRRPPEMDGSEGGWAFLAATFPKPANELLREATDQEIALALAYEKARSEEKAAKSAKELAGQQIAALIGDDLGVKSGRDWTFKYRYQGESHVKAHVRAAGRVLDFRRKGEKS